MYITGLEFRQNPQNLIFETFFKMAESCSPIYGSLTSSIKI